MQSNLKAFLPIKSRYKKGVKLSTSLDPDWRTTDPVLSKQKGVRAFGQQMLEHTIESAPKAIDLKKKNGLLVTLENKCEKCQIQRREAIDLRGKGIISVQFFFQRKINVLTFLLDINGPPEPCPRTPV